MSVIDQINRDLVEAMKARDEVKTSTLRLLNSSFKNKEIEIGHGLNDDEVLEVVVKAAKQRKESIEAYRKGDRDDLAAREEEELGLISKYLPEQLGEEDVVKLVDEVIASSGAKSQADMGRVTGEVMSRVKGQADGAVVSRIVREKLTSG